MALLSHVLVLSLCLALPVQAFAATSTVTLAFPLSNAPSRMTKIFYGTYVTPTSSPVMPERFTGYHTGVDLETTLAEANSDVPVSSICDGRSRSSSGPADTAASPSKPAR